MDIENIQQICMALKAVTEDVKWDHDLVFSVGEKMFCAVALDPPFKCSFKVPDETFEELSIRDGFMPAPYLARAKWILVSKPEILNKKQWEEYISQSYELVKQNLTKKQRQSLGI